MTVHRKSSGESSGKSSGKIEPEPLSKTAARIVHSLQDNPKVTLPEIAKELGITERAIEKQIKALREANIIRRIGPAKGGHWEVVE